MAKAPQIDWKPGQTIIRDAQGNIIARRSAADAGNAAAGGGLGGKLSPLKQFAAVVSGFEKPGFVAKDAQKALAKLDVSSIGFKDLAKFGLDDNLTREQFKEFKGLFKDAQAGGKGNKVGKKEIKALATFGQDTAFENTMTDLEKGVDKIVGDVKDTAPKRGELANLDLSIFARRAVGRAQGVRAALGTTMRGDAGYGRSLARISLGAM